MLVFYKSIFLGGCLLTLEVWKPRNPVPRTSKPGPSLKQGCWVSRWIWQVQFFFFIFWLDRQRRGQQLQTGNNQHWASCNIGDVCFFVFWNGISSQISELQSVPLFSTSWFETARFVWAPANLLKRAWKTSLCRFLATELTVYPWQKWPLNAYENNHMKWPDLCPRYVEAVNHVGFHLALSGAVIFRDQYFSLFTRCLIWTFSVVASPELYSVPRLKGQKEEFTSRNGKNPGLQDVSEFAAFCSLGSFASKAWFPVILCSL